MRPSPKKAQAMIDAVTARAVTIGLTPEQGKELGEVAASVYLTRISPLPKAKVQQEVVEVA